MIIYYKQHLKYDNQVITKFDHIAINKRILLHSHHQEEKEKERERIEKDSIEGLKEKANRCRYDRARGYWPVNW